MPWGHQMLIVGEELSQKIQHQVTGCLVIIGIHGHFTEKIPHIGVFDDHSPQPVPQVIKREHSFTEVYRRLIFRLYERPSELNGIGEVIADEFMGELKQFCSC